MKHNFLLTASMMMATLFVATSCMDDDVVGTNLSGSSHKINLSGEISQVYQTRVSDSGFCDGDAVGIYIVDYDGTTAGTLADAGNRADNVKHTFDEAAYKWNSAHDIYWKDNKTHIDIYGYYPFSSPDNVSAYTFEVQKDQSTPAAYGKLGGYELSDFLWGKAEDIAPTDQVIRLGFHHIMSSARVTLVEGTGFAEGEWEKVDKAVLILNTTRTANIDLSKGTVTATGTASEQGTIPYLYGDDFRAVVVPQEVAAGTPLLSITVDGKPYLLKKNETTTYLSAKQLNFTVQVNKRTDSGYELILKAESITAWENDDVSHDATAREYVVINVPQAGTLDSCIVAANKDVAKLQNLKVTGQINSRDFAVMRFAMERLRALNLKEAEIVAGSNGNLYDNPDWGYIENSDLEIPTYALYDKTTLTSLVLPDKLRKINDVAFYNCLNLSGSLIIPEGVVSLGKASFWNCKGYTGTLSLPSTLKSIGYEKGYIGYWDGTFYGCRFVCELKLPDGLEEIGMGAFDECRGLYGNLKLPENLVHIGEMAFANCPNLTGSIEIPQGVTKIPSLCFSGSGFNGNLILHDGISAIEAQAFDGTHLKGELRLPKDLEVISEGVFHGCDFSGELVLPKGLRTIGDKCFAYNWRLTGTLEIPENVVTIGAGAFAHCRSLEGIIFPRDLETVRYEPSYYEDGGAFEGCFGIGRIVCKGTIPAYVQDGAFNGVPKDNFTLEVPESAIQQYQAATGWKDFKRISAYRNLVIRPSIATAINTKATRDLVLTADDEWVVESKPDWVTLSANSGKGKTELKLTFAEMAKGSDPREGEVVFKLVDKDYRTRCRVTQYDYQYGEDEIITLQKASRGAGVNLMFLGDGYNAQEISEGKMLANIKEAVEHYFSIEPYTTYRDYFNVYTGIAVSPESGIGSVNTIIYNRFNTTAKGGVTLGGRNEGDDQVILQYACKAPTINASNINQTLIVMIPNTEDYGGICYMYDEGAAIAYCPMSDYGYPLDFRGVIQHEAGGHGFGKLGDEYIYHNAFIDACSCTCCGHVSEFNYAKALGWYANLSLTGKINEVPWSHFIFHEKYSQIVDIFEGGFMHTRGVYRSEQNSCMNNDIPYYSTISREAIVKRIKAIAGEPYSFDDFVANDKLDVNANAPTRNSRAPYASKSGTHQHRPVMMGKMPKLNVK